MLKGTKVSANTLKKSLFFVLLAVLGGVVLFCRTTSPPLPPPKLAAKEYLEARKTLLARLHPRYHADLRVIVSKLGHAICRVKRRFSRN